MKEDASLIIYSSINGQKIEKFNKYAGVVPQWHDF